MITPAISVLSAVEGLEVATPVLKPYVVPLTVVVLVGLFVVQSHGSARIGMLFGPAMSVWFAALAAAGLWQVTQTPAVFAALDPRHSLGFLSGHGWTSFLALGSVFLALTGAEALYADMGHFGRAAIRLGWLGLVLPALIFNYFGQGAWYWRIPKRSTYSPLHLSNALNLMPNSIISKGMSAGCEQLIPMTAIKN
jgi:KUP system potassium uptake protein